jgi:hypothetical protein
LDGPPPLRALFDPFFYHARKRTIAQQTRGRRQSKIVRGLERNVGMPVIMVERGGPASLAPMSRPAGAAGETGAFRSAGLDFPARKAIVFTGLIANPLHDRLQHPDDGQDHPYDREIGYGLSSQGTALAYREHNRHNDGASQREEPELYRLNDPHAILS